VLADTATTAGWTSKLSRPTVHRSVPGQQSDIQGPNQWPVPGPTWSHPRRSGPTTRRHAQTLWGSILRALSLDLLPGSSDGSTQDVTRHPWTCGRNDTPRKSVPKHPGTPGLPGYGAGSLRDVVHITTQVCIRRHPTPTWPMKAPSLTSRFEASRSRTTYLEPGRMTARVACRRCVVSR
jgi:hypothetical protein